MCLWYVTPVAALGATLGGGHPHGWEVLVVPVLLASPLLSTSLWEGPGPLDRAGWLRRRGVLGVLPNNADNVDGDRFF